MPKTLFLLALLTCGSLAVPSVASARSPKAVLRDETTQLTAATYTLPSGWKGFGQVVWNPEASLSANICVRTMQLTNPGRELLAHYISSFETPIRSLTTDAAELSRLLEPAVQRLPGYDLQSPSGEARLLPVREELRAYHMGRDRILRELGQDIKGDVYLLCTSYEATRTDPATGEKTPSQIICGAVVHERSTREAGKRQVTASFHDIFILGGPAASPEEEQTAEAPILTALSDLRRTMTEPRFNSRWLQTHIRVMAQALDGMPRVDDKALPRLEEKAESGIRMGLPTVLDAMEKQYSSPPLPGGEERPQAE